MTLVIEEVKHAEYVKDGSVVFYVTCEGVSGVLDVTLQSGIKNGPNNLVLQTWLDNNTPSAYSNKSELAYNEIKSHRQNNSTLLNKSAEDIIFMTDAERLQYKSDKEDYLQSLSTLLVKASDIDNEYVRKKIEKDNA